jgi:zinc-ribbon domain
MRRGLLLGTALAVVAFTVVSLIVYSFRPTTGTVFLGLGWLSILATGYLLVRAVQTFDLRVGGGVVDELSHGRRDELEREKKLLVKAIKEVEFDRESGKLDGGEAAEAIARYRGRAVEILRLLDEGQGREYEALIEKELAKRLAANPPEPRACPACQTQNDDDAAFCKKCGAKLESL